MLTYIDLFSGAGGFSLGFDNAGYSNIFAVEKDAEICRTYRHNFLSHNLMEIDITQLSDTMVRNATGSRRVDVVIGGPPCQGFSMAGNIGRKFIDDPRNQLFREFVRIVAISKPSCFVMENVARLYSHLGGQTREEIIREFCRIGYDVEARIICAADYGVPQFRNRVLFIGKKKNLNIPICFPEKTSEQPKTIKDAIDSYPPSSQWRSIGYS